MGKTESLLLNVFLLLLSCSSSTFASVMLTTNFAQAKDVPCSGDLITVTCSVVGSSLRWIITDTSLDIIGRNFVTLLANPDHVGTLLVISTSSVDLKFYQTCTIQNVSHPSSSTIESQMQFNLSSNEFVEVSCTNLAGMEDSVNITTLGDPTAPTDLRKIRTIVDSGYSYHVIEWNGGDTSLKEYALIRVTDEVVEKRIHPEVNTTIFNKMSSDDVTLAIVAISHCNVKSGMSNPLALSRVGPSPDCEWCMEQIIAFTLVILVMVLVIVLACLCCYKLYVLKKKERKTKDDSTITGGHSTDATSGSGAGGQQLHMQATKEADTTGEMQASVKVEEEADLIDDTLEISQYKGSKQVTLQPPVAALVEIKSKNPTQVLQEMAKGKIVFNRKRT